MTSVLLARAPERRDDAAEHPAGQALVLLSDGSGFDEPEAWADRVCPLSSCTGDDILLRVH